MKIRFPVLAAIITIVLTIFFVSPVSAQIADGTYEVDYEVKEDGTDNASLSDGYFTKPATLTVENGVQHIQLTVTDTNYIESLTIPGSSIETVNDDQENNIKTIKFIVDGDLSQRVHMDMTINVPEMNMENFQPSAQAVFDVSGLPQADSTPAQDSGDDSDEASGAAVENPPTGDNSSIALYAFLLLGSGIALLVIWKLRPARN
ncbi:NEAT domain-containing protein [Virgibacillus kimchii]